MTVNILDAQRRYAQIQQRHREKLKHLAEVQGRQMVAYATGNFRWTPHTHNAERTIGSDCVWRDDSRLRLSLTSGVNYSIYLEYVNFRHKGRLSIWWPTLNRYRLSILNEWRDAVSRY